MRGAHENRERPRKTLATRATLRGTGGWGAGFKTIPLGFPDRMERPQKAKPRKPETGRKIGQPGRVASVRRFPVVGGFGVDVDGDGEFDGGFRRALHHGARDRHGLLGFSHIRLEDQLVVHL
jgi:hypothetical protein